MGNFCDNCGSLIPPQKNGTCPYCENDQHGSDNYQIQDEIEEKMGSSEGLFPFRDVREGQKEFMEDSKDIFSKGDSLIAHAPTGIGKTAAVITSAIKTKREDEKIFFLTSKQSQHRIAINTVKNMPSEVSAVDVISKQNMCPREESRLPYPVFEKFCSENGQQKCNLFNKEMGRVVENLKDESKHVHRIVDICKSQSVCPHKAALMAGKSADIIVCDYNYIFSDIRERIFDLLDLELEDASIIVDEAHNLPDRVRGNLKEELNISILNEAFKLLQDPSPSLASFVRRLANEFQEIDEDEKGVDKDYLDKRIEAALKGGFGQFKDIKSVMDGLEDSARDILERDPQATAPLKLFSFLSDWSIEGEEVFRSFKPNPPTFKVGLLDPAKKTEDVFNRVSSSVLMSGTLHPGEMYADILGIDDPFIEKYRTPFPKKNRKIVSTKNLTTSYKEREITMFQAYANSLADVANNTPGNVAVFFPSYNLLQDIENRLNMVHLEKNILVEEKRHSKRDREKMVDRLKSSDSNILLAVQGGSLSEGVDYRNNILSAVIVAGIPFPPPSLETKALQGYYTEKFGKHKGYNYASIYPALNSVLQAAGRCIRSKEDRGLIVLMDKRFNYPRYKKSMPDEFEYDKTDDLVKVCEDFF